jgi:quercetin dioxygenase-like cupin family protein
VASPGDVLEIPALGGRVVLRETAAKTDGELVSFDFFVEPGKLVVQEHFHPNQAERFEVVSGRMEGKVAGERRVVRQGEVVEVPKGTPHGWWNAGDDQAHLVVEFRPALRSELMLVTFSRLSREGKVPDSGRPGFPLMAVLLADFHEETRPAGVPAPILWGMTRLVAPVARLFGYRAVQSIPDNTETAVQERVGNG